MTLTKIGLLRISMLKYHTDEEVELFNNLVQSATCAYLDLKGSLEAYESGGIHQHDWEGHQQSINELNDVLGEELLLSNAAPVIDRVTETKLDDGDYVLSEGAGWFELDRYAVRIHKTDFGVAVDIYEAEGGLDDPITSAFAWDET